MGATHIWTDSGPLLTDHGVIVAGQEFDGAIVTDIGSLVSRGKAAPIAPPPEVETKTADHSATVVPPAPVETDVPAAVERPKRSRRSK